MWTSGWLAFFLKASKFFSGLDFNFQVPTEGEAEESYFNDEADLMVLANAPSFVPLSGEPEFETPAEASSPTSMAGTSPFDVHVAQSPDLDV